MSKNIKLISAVCIGMLFVIFGFTDPSRTAADQDPKALAVANQYHGKYVFMQCEPQQAYTIAFQYKAVVHTFGHAPTLEELAEGTARFAVDEAKNNGKEFDAVLCTDGKFDIAIKFK